MTITVAGNKKEYEDGLKLTELIEKEDIESPEYVTVTINDEFISKEDVPNTVVKKTATLLNSCTTWEEAQDNGFLQMSRLSVTPATSS